MSEKYVVLRSFPAPRGLDIRRGSEDNSQGPNISISTVAADELPQLRQDRHVKAFAPSLPVQLIRPISKQLDSKGGSGGGDDVNDIAWGVRAVGAHKCRYDGDGITVAVLDTGIDTEHVAFAGMEFEQKDFTCQGPENPRDHDGHGTHCAGIIFGRTTQGTRLGVAPGVKFALNAKVIGPDGGSSEAIADAISWAAQKGAHVISMSLGIDFPAYVKALIKRGIPEEPATSMALEGYRQNITLFERLATLLRARAQPPLVVAAAGNESRRDGRPPFRIAASPPAASEGIISVAALGLQADGLEIAPFSNTGALVAGPGVNILSAACGGGLITMSGTSMAAPHVAGVAALWAQKLRMEGLLNAAQFQASILGSARRERLLAGTQSIDAGAGLAMAPPN